MNPLAHWKKNLQCTTPGYDLSMLNLVFKLQLSCKCCCFDIFLSWSFLKSIHAAVLIESIRMTVLTWKRFPLFSKLTYWYFAQFHISAEVHDILYINQKQGLKIHNDSDENCAELPSLTRIESWVSPQYESEKSPRTMEYGYLDSHR